MGKLLIPPEILFKPTGPTESEMEIFRNHPASGYPSGISGADIPLPSRIISVVDSYEAMTSERPYRKGLSHRKVVNRLKAGKSTQFDPEIIESFLRAIKSSSINNICKIETKLDL